MIIPTNKQEVNDLGMQFNIQAILPNGNMKEGSCIGFAWKFVKGRSRMYDPIQLF